jgi:hypothetical protein
MPQIEYGPPGHKGVTQIMGLGAASDVAALVPKDTAARNTGLLAAATWLGGLVIGNNTAKNIGIGGLLAVAYIQVLKRAAQKKQAAALVEIPLPIDVQGWG